MSKIETKLIDGLELAEQIQNETAAEIVASDLDPGLAVVLVGDNPASHLYVGLKEKACKKVGIRFEKYIFASDASQDEILRTISDLNQRDDIDAILIQLPLPEHLDESAIIRAMSPEKDVDGFHPLAVLSPGLAEGIFLLVKRSGLRLKGKTFSIISNSEVFAEPVRDTFINQGMSEDGSVSEADVIVIAVGKPGSLTKENIKPGAIVIDVGTNRVNGKMMGDVGDLSGVAGAVTPVPGGVGPVTIAMLIKNTVKLAKKRERTS